MMIIMYLALTLDVVEFQYVTFKIPSKNMQLKHSQIQDYTES